MTDSAMQTKTLRERAQWYRDGCDGLEDRDGYYASGDVARDAASDIDTALALLQQHTEEIARLRAELDALFEQREGAIQLIKRKIDAEDRDDFGNVHVKIKLRGLLRELDTFGHLAKTTTPQEEIARLTQQVQDMTEKLSEKYQVTWLDREEEIARLRSALQDYGQHKGDCAIVKAWGRPDAPCSICTCGYEALAGCQAPRSPHEKQSSGAGRNEPHI